MGRIIAQVHVTNEVVFLDMEPVEGRYEPLLGSLILEQSNVLI